MVGWPLSAPDRRVCGRSRNFPSSVPLRGFLREHVQTPATRLGLGHVLAAREAALPFPGDGNAACGGCDETREARPGRASIVRRPPPAAVLGTQFLPGRRSRQYGVAMYPHRFRHHFSHTWLDRGGAEGDLMELNGWTSPQMLRRYDASARSTRARRSYHRIMDPSPDTRDGRFNSCSEPGNQGGISPCRAVERSRLPPHGPRADAGVDAAQMGLSCLVVLPSRRARLVLRLPHMRVN